MPRIKIKDLPEDRKISRQELKRVKGGLALSYPSYLGLVKPVPAVSFKSEYTTSYFKS
ncbi:MAG: hypothetical protein JRD68_04250 [Deltaproteobacteria bacterium]|nr:hypothetical protein [Deltaproteobacteria bacterium]